MRKNTGKKEVIQTAKIWTGAILTAFTAAAAIYLVLLQIEKNTLAGYEKTEVYLAACEIPAGQAIREEDLENYFQPAQIDSELVPEKALQEPEQAVGTIAASGIDKGSVLTEGMFRELDEILEDMEHPVIAGFRADDLYQVVGGVLRSGDRIHIYSSEEGLGTFPVWENVYVQQVFDSSGNTIENSDKTTAAQRINIYLDKDEVERFYTGLEKGSLRVVRDWK